MPSVPLAERSVISTGIPDARLRANVPAPAMTGAIDTANKVAADVYEDEIRKVNQVVALDADLRLSELKTRLTNEASQYRGRDAHQAIDYVNAEWTKGVADIENGLSNDEQKLAVRNRIVGHWTGLNSSIQGYVSGERRRYDDEVTKSSIINRITESKGNYENPHIVEKSLSETRAIINDYGKRNGLSKEAIDMEYNEAERKIYQAVGDGFVENLSALIEAGDGEPLTEVYKQLKETKDNKYANFPMLDIKDRKTAIKDIDAWVVEAVRANKERDKQAQEAIEQSFIPKLTRGALTIGEIERSGLNSDKKLAWIGRVESRIEKAKSAVNGEFKTDKVKQAEIYTRIVNNPESVPDSEITDAIGNGLSASSAKSLIDDKRIRIGREDPQKTMQAKTATALLRNALTRKKMTNTEWGEYSSILQNYITKYPDEDPIAFVNEQILPPIVTSWKEGVQDLWFGTPGTEAARQNRIKELKGMTNTSNSLTEMPNPAQHKGEYLSDTITGKRYKSDGYKWVESK